MQLPANSIAFPSRILPFLVAICLLGLFAHTRSVWYHYYLPYFQARSDGTEHNLHIRHYLRQVIEDHRLSDKTEWTAWRVQPEFQKAPWKPVTDLSLSFQPKEPEVADAERHGIAVRGANGLLRLPVREPSPPFDASDFLFAISTTYERLIANDRAMLRSWQRWLTRHPYQETNGAHIVVLFDQATNEEILDAEALLHSFGINGVVYTTNELLSRATKYYGLMEELHAFGGVLAATSKVPKKWFALIEDDVFFPSMEYLDLRLQKYDPEDELYLGIPSSQEDWEEVEGEMNTYGGGVVILSHKAVERVLSPSCSVPKSSKPPFHGQKWERLVHDCLVNHGDLKMNVIPGNYSPSLASGRPLALKQERENQVSLGDAHLVADICGESCYMQKYLFRDDWILVNGVSIRRGSKTRHEERSEPVALASQIVLQDAGRSNERLSEDGSKWDLIDSTQIEDGSVWQAYARKGAVDDKELGVLDSVIILIWEHGR